MNEILGDMRRWIQWNALNGSSVTWGSDEVLHFPKELTVRDFEELAIELNESEERRRRNEKDARDIREEKGRYEG